MRNAGSWQAGTFLICLRPHACTQYSAAQCTCEKEAEAPRRCPTSRRIETDRQAGWAAWKSCREYQVVNDGISAWEG